MLCPTGETAFGWVKQFYCRCIPNLRNRKLVEHWATSRNAVWSQLPSMDYIIILTTAFQNSCRHTEIILVGSNNGYRISVFVSMVVRTRPLPLLAPSTYIEKSEPIASLIHWFTVGDVNLLENVFWPEYSSPLTYFFPKIIVEMQRWSQSFQTMIWKPVKMHNASVGKYVGMVITFLTVHIFMLQLINNNGTGHVLQIASKTYIRIVNKQSLLFGNRVTSTFLLSTLWVC